MEKQVLANLEPKSVLRFFEELCAIPHGSGNTAAASDWAVDFAKTRGLRYRRDEAGNVVIWKDASPGYEDHPAVMLQGHLDMVCVADAGVDHDFTKDGLELAVDGDWIRARGTTLGGDDGIAVAMAMAVLDDDAIPHPPLEAVFTVDEEIGLLGATALDCSDLKSKYLLNIDSEAEGILTVGCAGGARCDLHIPLPAEAASGDVFTLSVSGLPGGHSGAEIHKNIPNANRVLARCLTSLPGVRLISLHGGEQDNAIPGQAEARVLLPAGGADSGLLESAFRQALAGEVPGASCALAQTGGGTCRALSGEDSRRALELILSAPNGVQAMEPDLPGQVRTSLNLGILRLEEGALRLTWSVRSSAAAEKEALVEKLKALSAAGSFTRRGDYPAWEYRKDSPLRDTMVAVFKEQYGREPKVETIHAGLECGILSAKMPELDAVSFGPDLADIHTPRERASLSSLRRTWAYLVAVLARL